LVVEDEGLIAMQSEELLVANGGRLECPAGTVEEALRLLISERPDSAALDLTLTDRRSDESASALCGAGVPFVVCTCYGEGPELSDPLA
jgi:DNA-binding response OmpR family regulator